MKKIKLFLMPALFSMAAGCSNPAGSPADTSSPRTLIHRGTDSDGYIYYLELTESAGGAMAAAYAPKKGDSYVLTYYNGSVPKKSVGRVTAQGSGTVSLKPDKTGAPAISAGVSANGLTALTASGGSITFDDLYAGGGKRKTSIQKIIHSYTL